MQSRRRAMPLALISVLTHRRTRQIQVRAIYIQREDERFGLTKVERVYSKWVTVILVP